MSTPPTAPEPGQATSSAFGKVSAFLTRPSVSRVLRAALAVLILFFFGLALVDLWPRMAAYPWQLEPWWLALALAVLVARGPLPAVAWWQIMRRLGHPLRLRQAIRMVYYSALAGYLPGSMWHAVSRVYLAEKVGVPRLVTLLSVAIESVLNLLAAGLVACLSIAAWPDLPLWALVPAAVALAALLARPDLFFKLIDRALRLVGRKPLQVTLSTKDLAAITLPFVVNWLAFGVVFFASLAAVYPQISLTQLPLVTGAFTAAWVVGYLAVFVPQGLGVRELVVVGLLSATGIPAPAVTAAALLARLWSIVGVGVWGGISTRL